MPSLELNPSSNRYHVRFRFAGRAFKRSLKTSDRMEAEAALARVTETMSLVDRGVLELPTGADVTAFLLSYGKRSKKPEIEPTLSLRDLIAKYQSSLPSHAKEASTLETEEIHLRHFRRYLPMGRPLAEITTEVVQAYVNTQLRRKVRGNPISPETVKRQMILFVEYSTGLSINRYSTDPFLHLGSSSQSGMNSRHLEQGTR